MVKLYSIALVLLLMPFFIFSQIPTGAGGLYGLNTNANDASGNGFNGTISGTSNTTNRFGDANTALAFTSGVSAGSLPSGLVTYMQNDFTFGFWFKTGMSGASGSQWYNGTSMVDAEVGGVVSDWGINLIDGGKVCFGMGNPGVTDMTIKSSSAAYNDNAWHFVTGTRDKTGGNVILYVDGSMVASGSGFNTGSLNSPPFIGLGRNTYSNPGNYTGSLDDIIVYNRVLSSTEVSNLYSAMQFAALPLSWLSFSAEPAGKNVLLEWQVANATNNASFTVESSADAAHFSEMGSLPATAGTDYHFTTVPARYYRIRQTDIDGRSSYSKIISFNMQNAGAAFYLQTNPVTTSVTIVNTGQESILQLRFADMNGRTVIDQTVQNSSSLITSNTSRLAPGYYIISVQTAKGQYLLPMVKK